jgi:hypothetical protein
MNEATDMADAADSAAPNSPLAKAVKGILNLIKGAARWIFSLIFRITTPKGWTLTTQIGLPMVGEVGVAINFG